MLSIKDISAIKTIKNFLDEVAYNYISYRMLPGHDTLIFPEFSNFQQALEHFNEPFRFILTVFRQGHSAEEQSVRALLPKNVFDAMVAVGLLVKNSRGHWRTPGVSIIPIEGLYLVVSIPPHYPVALSTKIPIYLGPDSILLMRQIPINLNGAKVLDVCAGSGIHGALCAIRGASKVLCLEKSKDAVGVANFNVHLNWLQDKVEIRESDVFSSLSATEKFDFFISNPPFMPVVQGIDYPAAGDGGGDGTLIIKKIVENISHYLTENAHGVIFCNALGNQHSINLNQNFLKKIADDMQLFIQAFVCYKYPIAQYIQNDLGRNLKYCCPDLNQTERDQKISNWLNELKISEIPCDYLYEQIIRFYKGKESGFANIAVYNPAKTDPLYEKISSVSFSK